MERTDIKKCFSSEIQPFAPGFEELSGDGRAVKRRHKVTTGVNLKYYEFLLTLEKICSNIATVPENAYSSVIQELFRTLANYRVLICDPMANMLVDALQRLSELNIIYVLKQTELIVMNILLPETVKDSNAINMFTISLRLLVLNMIVCGLARRDLHNAISFSIREPSTLDYELDVQCATMHTQSNHCCLCIAENYPKRDIDERGADLILDDVRKEFINYSRITRCTCIANSNLCEQCLCSLRESLYLTYIFYKFEDEKKLKSMRDKNAELRIFKAKSLAKRDARLRASTEKMQLQTAGRNNTPPVLNKRARFNLTNELLESTPSIDSEHQQSQKIVYEDSDLQLRVRKSGAIGFKRKSANGYDNIVILSELKEPPNSAHKSMPMGMPSGKFRRGRLSVRSAKVSRTFIDKLINDSNPSRTKKRSEELSRGQSSALCAKKPGLAQRFVKVISTALLNNERLLNESVMAELCKVVFKLRGSVLKITRCNCKECTSTMNDALTPEDMRPIILALFLHNEILNNNFLMDICNDKMFMSLQMPRRSAYKMYFNIVDNRKSIIKDKLAEARTRIHNITSSLLLYDLSAGTAMPISLCFAIRQYGTQLHDMYRLDLNAARNDPENSLIWLKNSTNNDGALFLYKSEQDSPLPGQVTLDYNTVYHTYHTSNPQGTNESFDESLDPWSSAVDSTSMLRQGPAVTSRTLNRYNKMRHRPKYAVISGVVVKSVKRDLRMSDNCISRKRRNETYRGKEGILCCQANTSELEATMLQMFDSTLLGHLLRVYCNILSNQIDCHDTDYRGFYDQFHYLNRIRSSERYESDMFVLMADRTFKATENVVIEENVLLRNRGPLSMKNIPRVIKYYARTTLDAFTKFEFNNTLIVLFRPTGNNYFVIQFENDRSIIVQHIAKCILVELVCKDPLGADAPLTSTERYFENVDNALFSKNEVSAIRDFLKTDNTLPKADNSYSTLIFLIGEADHNDECWDEAIHDCERIAEMVMKVKTVAIKDRCASVVLDKIFEAAWNSQPVSYTRQIDERTLACIPAHDVDPICTWTREEHTTICTVTKHAVVFVGQLLIMSDYNVLDMRLLDCFRRRISVLKCSSRAGVIIPLNGIPNCANEVASFLRNGINHIENYRCMEENITRHMLLHDTFAVMFTATTTALHLSLDHVPAIRWNNHRGIFHGRHGNMGFLSTSANKLLLAVYAATVLIVNTYHRQYFALKDSLLLISERGHNEVNFLRLRHIVRRIVLVDGYIVSKESQSYDYKKLISSLLVGERAVLSTHPQHPFNGDRVFQSVGHYHRCLHVLYVHRKLIDYFTSQYSDIPMESDPTAFMLNIVANAKKFISHFENRTVIRVPLRDK